MNVLRLVQKTSSQSHISLGLRSGLKKKLLCLRQKPRKVISAVVLVTL